MIDWEDCDIVERVPGKMSGQPVVKGTRILADTVVIDEELGCTPEETHESFPALSVDVIYKLRAFARSKRQLVP